MKHCKFNTYYFGAMNMQNEMSHFIVVRKKKKKTGCHSVHTKRWDGRVA